MIRFNKPKKFPLPGIYFMPLIYVCCIFFNSCKSHKNSDIIDQGIIEYDITYSNRDGKNFPFQLLPKIMVMKFNKTFSCYTLEDRLGLFSISNILNNHDNKHVTFIKVFDKKYVYNGKKNEPSVLFDTSLDYIFTDLPDTSRVIGYLCKTANVTDKSTNQNFNILYSSNIGERNPNNSTPYATIDGMLLNFRLTLKNLELQLKANNIVEKEIKDQDFVVPKEYKPITRKQMEDIITTILP